MGNAGRQLHRNRELGKWKSTGKLKSKWGPRDFLKFLIFARFLLFFGDNRQNLFYLILFYRFKPFFQVPAENFIGLFH